MPPQGEIIWGVPASKKAPVVVPEISQVPDVVEEVLEGRMVYGAEDLSMEENRARGYGYVC
jgi:hypothetical protein